MLTHLLDRLGNWNPQLLREWNGRLKPLLVTLAVTVSVLVQVGLIFSFSLFLPEAIHPNHLYFTTAPSLGFNDNTAPSSLKVSEVKSVQAVVGSPETIAAEQIRPGDTILSINGEAVPENQSPDTDPYRLANWAYEKLNASHSTVTLDHLQGKIPLGSPFTLELRNSIGKPYQVTLPIVVASSYNTYRTPFCVPVSSIDNTCRLSPDGQSYEVNWQKWYFSIFVSLTVIFCFALVGLGGFMIFSDLEQEQRRGTLSFVRLSPRSPLTMVTGKILGVPVLLYLSVLVATPFHYAMGLAAGFSGLGLLAFYLVFSVQLFLFYSSGFLLTLAHFGVVNIQAWLYSSLGLALGGGATLMTLAYNLGNYDGSPYAAFAFLWVGLFSPAMPLLYALNASPALDSLNLEFFLQFYMGGQMLSLGAYVVVALLNCGVILGIVYIALDRKFHNPGTTWIPRRYSYGLTIVLHCLFFLFAIPNTDITENWVSTDWLLANSIAIFLFTSVYLALLSLALIPNRQLLLDWLRFQGKTRSSGTSQIAEQAESLSPASRPSADFKSTLFWSDRGSPLPPLIVNLFLAEGIFLVWLGLMSTALEIQISLRNGLILLGSLALLSSMAILLLFLSQIILLTPFKNTQIWTFWGLLATIAVHPLFMVTSYIYLNVPSRALLFNLAPETWMMLSTLFLQSLGILGLGLFHRRQLVQAARSEWQELLGNLGTEPDRFSGFTL